MCCVNAINKNFKTDFLYMFFWFYLFSEDKTPGCFHLPFSSALCAFAYFSFGFANIWKRVAGGCFPYTKQWKFFSWPKKAQPLLVALQNVLLSQPVHLHRQGLSDVTLGELSLSCSSSFSPPWPAISPVPIPPGVFACQQQTRAGLFPPQPFISCPSLPLIPVGPLKVSLCVPWLPAKDNSCFLASEQMILKVHSLMTLVKAIPAGNPQFPQSCQQRIMGGTLREEYTKTKGQQLKHPRLGMAGRPKQRLAATVVWPGLESATKHPRALRACRQRGFHWGLSSEWNPLCLQLSF